MSGNTSSKDTSSYHNGYIDNDVNLMVYNEMSEVDAQHPAHQNTISADYRKLLRNKRLTSPQEEDEYDMDDYKEEEEEEEDVETSYEIHGVDGLEDDDGIGVVDEYYDDTDDSYDHMNEDEMDNVDMSDSPYA